MEEIIWTDGIEYALNDIRDKALKNSEFHKNNYYCVKGYLKYFRVPTIVLSGMNSVFSVGLQPYVSQGIISVLCCSISLICGIMASVELFLRIQDIMEAEIVASKEFYILSCDIFKTLSVERSHRTQDGIAYLENINSKYCNLIEQSNLTDKISINLEFMKNAKPEIESIKPEMESIKTDIENKTDPENTKPDIENYIGIEYEDIELVT